MAPVPPKTISPAKTEITSSAEVISSSQAGATTDGNSKQINANLQKLNQQLEALEKFIKEDGKPIEPPQFVFAKVNLEPIQGPIATLDQPDLSHLLEKAAFKLPAGISGEEPGTEPKPNLETLMAGLKDYAQNAFNAVTHNAPGGLQAKATTPDMPGHNG